ncbi:MAG: YgeY family selenium metabolism-linked hydrolase [Deltaproteobacteria bacterium]|nr:MAG: YgeY family selenium metabolism-linked hydrolase [Deltaproteobacteria bacterium]RLE02597.1 MAG: YgeY family selenium metabolism-linked hydrolase [Bacteroidota bacterium]
MKSNVKKLADKLLPDIIDFAKQLIRTKSYTGHEGDLADLVLNKMKELDYDHVSVDELGNVIGVVGDGPTRILFDSHMDTVGVNHPEEWRLDPFSGEIVDEKLYGRGSVDMKSALSAAIFAGHIVKRLGLQEGKTIYITASVMEEDYDGETVYSMCRHLESLPDYVVICEPSSLDLALGHKGRALLKVTSKGISAHGSAPEKGINAVYKMIPLLQRVEALNNEMMRKGNETGSIALTKICSSAESLNAIPDQCEVYIDRRLMLEEDKEVIAAEMNTLLEGMDVSWAVYDKRGKSYTGVPVVLHSFLPSWAISPDSILAKACIKSFKTLFEREPHLIKWDFCTNGVATAGRLNIPTIGFGPGDSKKAHTVDECCEISQIAAAVEFYAFLPFYL